MSKSKTYVTVKDFTYVGYDEIYLIPIGTEFVKKADNVYWQKDGGWMLNEALIEKSSYFKPKEQPNNKGWEIVSVYKGEQWSCDKSGFDWYLKNGYEISQVKRLSDDFIVTQGRSIGSTFTDDQFIIEKIDVSTGECYLMAEGHLLPLCNAKEPTQNRKTEPQLSTQEFKWDKSTIADFVPFLFTKAAENTPCEPYKLMEQFQQSKLSTTKGEERIEDKPLLSLNDIKDMYDSPKESPLFLKLYAKLYSWAEFKNIQK